MFLNFINTESKSGDNTPETILALLQTSAAESEEQSDKIAANLMSKEIAFEDFLKEFLDQRKEMHLRKLKADKMVELIQQQKNAARAGGIGGGSVYPNNFYGTPGGVPYPTGPYAMPMPGMPGMMYRHF